MKCYWACVRHEVLTAVTTNINAFWNSVVWYTANNVSQEPFVSIFWVEDFSLFRIQDTSTLKNKVAGSSFTIYQTIRCHIPEDNNLLTRELFKQMSS